VIGASGLHLLDVFLRDRVVMVGGLTINFANIWGLLLGAIFILVVMVFPNGVVGTWQRWRARRALAASGATAVSAHTSRKPSA
jgi:ABC-type branched-subunit amino acid transport system permease subunit